MRMDLLTDKVRNAYKNVAGLKLVFPEQLVLPVLHQAIWISVVWFVIHTTGHPALASNLNIHERK